MWEDNEIWLFFLFLGVPLIEIALFIQVGGVIGLWPTLAIVVATAIAGTVLVRSQGSQALENLRRSFDELRDPTETLAHGAMILFSGALLLTPGFFTDAVGFALLMPPVRSFILKKVRERVNVQTVSAQHPNWNRAESSSDDVIEGDYEVENEPVHGRDKPSGWTQH